MQVNHENVIQKTKAMYSSPVLRVFGKVGTLTQGTTSKRNDPGGPDNGKS